MHFSNSSSRTVFVVLFVLFIILAVSPLALIWPPIRSQLDYWFTKDREVQTEYVEISDKTEEKKVTDTDGDGLSDYAEENIFFTDPNKKDTDDDGFPDNVEVSVGMSPISTTKDRGDEDEDGLLNYQETMIYHTDPRRADTDSDGMNDGQELLSGTNPLDANNTQPYFAKNPNLQPVAAPGLEQLLREEQYHLIIPEVAVDVPIIWSDTADNDTVLEKLKSGVVHAFGTAYPGQGKAMVIFGHSSGVYWRKGDYDTVFATLDKLNTGDQIIIQNPTSRFVYTVTNQEVTTPDDPEIFADNGTETLTLITCYPFGTAYKRLFVRAELAPLGQ